MVEFVADDRVFSGEQGFKEPAVGVESGGIKDGVGGAEKRTELGFEFAVDFLGAADETHRGKSVAPAVEGGVGGGDDLGVVSEAEVVVRAKIQDVLAARDRDVGRLRGGDEALALGEAGDLNLAEGFLEVREVGGRHGSIPVEDDFAAAARAHKVKSSLELGIVKPVRDDR